MANIPNLITIPAVPAPVWNAANQLATAQDITDARNEVNNFNPVGRASVADLQTHVANLQPVAQANHFIQATNARAEAQQLHATFDALILAAGGAAPVAQVKVSQPEVYEGNQTEA